MSLHPYSTYLFAIWDFYAISFLPRNLWFPAEKPMVSRQETFKTHAAMKLQDSHMVEIHRKAIVFNSFNSKTCES